MPLSTTQKILHAVTFNLFLPPEPPKERKKCVKRAAAKMYCTTKFSSLQHDDCLREFAYWEEHFPSTKQKVKCYNRDQFTVYLNTVFKCNKSKSTYARIFNGTTPRPVPRIDDIGK